MAEYTPETLRALTRWWSAHPLLGPNEEGRRDLLAHADAWEKRERRIEALVEYVAFLGIEYQKVHSIANAHGYVTPSTVVERGMALRIALDRTGGG